MRQGQWREGGCLCFRRARGDGSGKERRLLPDLHERGVPEGFRLGARRARARPLGVHSVPGRDVTTGPRGSSGRRVDSGPHGERRAALGGGSRALLSSGGAIVRGSGSGLPDVDRGGHQGLRAEPEVLCRHPLLLDLQELLPDVPPVVLHEWQQTGRWKVDESGHRYGMSIRRSAAGACWMGWSHPWDAPVHESP